MSWTSSKLSCASREFPVSCSRCSVSACIENHAQGSLTFCLLLPLLLVSPFCLEGTVCLSGDGWGPASLAD